MPARLINIKYITIRAEKVASPVTALQLVGQQKVNLAYKNLLKCLLFGDPAQPGKIPDNWAI